MNNSTEEIEQLRKEILFIAHRVSTLMCAINYNMFLLHFSGEERTSYIEHWQKKEKAVRNEIRDSTTIEKSMKIADDFNKELFAYIKATKVDTADKAMEIAHTFIKKYTPVALPLKAEKEGNVWLVDIDVGALAVKIAKVKVDARTGDILSYDIPSK